MFQFIPYKFIILDSRPHQFLSWPYSDQQATLIYQPPSLMVRKFGLIGGPRNVLKFKYVTTQYFSLDTPLTSIIANYWPMHTLLLQIVDQCLEKAWFRSCSWFVLFQEQGTVHFLKTLWWIDQKRKGIYDRLKEKKNLW